MTIPLLKWDWVLFATKFQLLASNIFTLIIMSVSIFLGVANCLKYLYNKIYQFGSVFNLQISTNTTIGEMA